MGCEGCSCHADSAIKNWRIISKRIIGRIKRIMSNLKRIIIGKIFENVRIGIIYQGLVHIKMGGNWIRGSPSVDLFMWKATQAINER